jgi:hypothetical protein
MVNFRVLPFVRQLQQWGMPFSQSINFGDRVVLVSSLLALTLVSGGKPLNWVENVKTSSVDFLIRLQVQQSLDSKLSNVTVSDHPVYALPLQVVLAHHRDLPAGRHREGFPIQRRGGGTHWINAPLSDRMA